MQDNHHDWPERANGETLKHLKEAIKAGEPWHLALLEAIGLWTLTEETCNGQVYSYLVAGEAFDWVLLAERLCRDLDGIIPEEEKAGLLFQGRLPGGVSEELFRELVGEDKYRQHLNYFYGIVVEQFLQLAVEEEISRERQAHFLRQEKTVRDDAHCRLYGHDELTLLRKFRAERNQPASDVIELQDWQEFIYWLFKYRLRKDDRALVASNTKKGLDCFRRQLQAKDLTNWENNEKILDLRCRQVEDNADRRTASISASI